MKKNQYSDNILDQTKDLVWAVDKNFGLVYANRPYLNLIQEARGVKKVLPPPILEEGFNDGDIEKWKAYYQRALSGESFEIEEHFYHPETREMQYRHITFSSIRDEDGEIQTVACRNTDITSLIGQKDHASQLLDASVDVFCTIDEAGKFVYVSAASTELWGYTPEELVGKPFRDLIVAEDLEKTGQVAIEVMAGKITKAFSNRYQKKNEDLAYNLWSARWDDDSKLMYCVVRDAKEKIEEEAEKELLSQISQIFNNEEELIPASNRLCEILYAFGKFDVIELWCPNMEQTQIKLIGRSSHSQDFYDLEPSEISFQKNEGLPGKVWQNGKQLLWDEKQINKYFVRKKGATHLGLQAILGIPMKFNEELMGVLLIGTKRELDYLDQNSLVLSRLEKFIGSEINRKRLENDLKHLYQSVPEILCVADFNGRFLKMNPAGCELLGYKEDEILFHSFDEFVHPEDKLVSAKEVEKHEKDANTFQFENRYITKSGKIIWLSWSCNSSIHEGLIYASAKNITKEVQLRELNKQASSLAKIGSWEIDVVNNKLFWTDMVHVVHETDPLSFTPDLETGINFYREDFREVVKQQTANCMTNGTPFNFEAVLVTAKNNERWVRSIGNPEFLNGKCIRVYGSFQDIHDRKTFEEALRESEANFRTIFEIASLGIAQVSPSDGQILLVNSYYKDITGYNHEELLQMKFSELTHPDDQQQDWNLFSKAVRGEIEYRNEKRYIRKDGSTVWVRIHLAFIRNEHGEPIKTVAICENIMERKEMESRLKNLSDNMPGVVFQYVIYPDGRDKFNYVSKGAKTIWGYGPEEVMANNQIIWNRIEAGGDLDLLKGSIADSIRSKSGWNATWKYLLPTGKIRTHIGHGSPEYLADGTVVFNSLILDVTEEKRTEELLNQATSMARIGSWEMTLMDQEGDTMYWSPMTREILEVDDNYNPSLTSGFEFYDGESKEKIEQAVDLLIKKGQEFDLELVIHTTKGNNKWIRCIGKADYVDEKCVRVFGSFQDVTDIKESEISLHKSLKSLEDYKFALDQTAIITITDTKGIITFVNDKFCEISKYSREELLGNSHKIINSKYHSKSFFIELWKTIAQGKIFRAEIKNQAKDGSYYWVDSTIIPFLDENNKPFQYLAIRIDVTAQKLANEKIIEILEEKNHILESIGDAFFAVDEKWTITYWNKQAETVIGKKKEDMLGKNLWEEYPDAIDSDLYRQYHQAVETGETVNFEEYYPNSDTWIEVSVYPSETGLSIYFKDITFRKKADIRLLEANERFEIITQATNDAIWDYDIVENTLFWGDGFKSLFGYDVEKITPTLETWTSHIHSDDLERVESSVFESINDKNATIWQQEYQYEKADGTFAFVYDKGIILRNKEGKAVRMLGAMSDFTQLKKQEAELLEVNESLINHTKELERSNEELEQFAFITSHDLQEPLRMITSFMDLLKKRYADQLDDKAHQYIHFATDGAKRMKQIILDLLLYSRANKPSEELQEVDLNEIVSEYTQLRRKLIAEKNATITFDELPVLETYRAPVTQIVHCLLDNALRYMKENEPPFIKIHAEEKKTLWEFAVQDNGIGIDQKFYDKIFILFQRLHNRNQHDGTGIGLSIAKRSVEFLGGEIWLESNVGEGSTFYFTIAKINNQIK